MTAKQIAINALDLIFNPLIYNTQGASLDIYKDDDIYMFTRLNENDWEFHSEFDAIIDDDYEPIIISKDEIIKFINRLRKINIVIVHTKLDKGDIYNRGACLYYCKKSQGHLNCEDETEPIVQQLQKNYRYKRDLIRKEKRNSINQEIKALPPLGTFLGGVDYLDVYEKNRKYYE